MEKQEKERLFENLYDLYDISRQADTVAKEFLILRSMDDIAEGMGVLEEFLEYLDSRLEEDGILFRDED